MTSISETTPVRVARLATQTQDFRPGETLLIGLFGPQARLSALVRSSNGTIRRVEVGERLDSGRIIGIDTEGLVLEKNGETWRLTLPSG